MNQSKKIKKQRKLGTPNLRSKFSPLNLFKGGGKRQKKRKMEENVTPVWEILFIFDAMLHYVFIYLCVYVCMYVYTHIYIYPNYG